MPCLPPPPRGSIAVDADERREQKNNDESARLWISGVEALKKNNSLKCIYDLSATPFYLKGSGYAGEEQLFQWVVSDFALMDAIECGIVKLPRVPVEDGAANIDGLPTYRNIYNYIKRELPKKGRSKQGNIDPENLPEKLLGALESLYGHYEKTYQSWIEAEINVPPVFIIVCNNTSTSKLVYDYISGYKSPNSDSWTKGNLSLFNNIGADGRPMDKIQTLLIDSEQLDSGEAMSDEFKIAASSEIAQFRNDIRQRFPERDSDKQTDEDLLREVMNTVGKTDRLGEQVRCVVSVSMLTEGWDANNVTHILGLRAFRSQLLCEQVVGRGLRRFSYDIEEDGKQKGLLSPEYADVFGVPFVFADNSNSPAPKPPKKMIRVRAIPDRSKLEIVFPNISGYIERIPEGKIEARFNENSHFNISPNNAPPVTELVGIVGEEVIMNLDQLKLRREQEVIFNLVRETAKKFAQSQETNQISPSVYRDLFPIVKNWLKNYVCCLNGTFIQYLLWKPLAIRAAERIFRACIPPQIQSSKEKYIIPIIDRFSAEGSTHNVDFLATDKRLYKTKANKSHINYADCDSDWELHFCRIIEDNPRVISFTRNSGLGFEIPYVYQDQTHRYLPDFIVLIDDGCGIEDLLSLVVEIKGKKDDKARVKADTMNQLWIPAVNNYRRWGRWAFVEIMDMQDATVKLAEFTNSSLGNSN